MRYVVRVKRREISAVLMQASAQIPARLLAIRNGLERFARVAIACAERGAASLENFHVVIAEFIVVKVEQTVAYLVVEEREDFPCYGNPSGLDDDQIQFDTQTGTYNSA